MTQRPNGSWIAFVTAALVGFAPLAAAAQGITEVIALTGTAPPQGNGTFATFTEAPVLNNSGQTAFRAGLSGTSGGETDDTGIYRGEASAGDVALIVREKGHTPNQSGITHLGDPTINASGQLAFTATYVNAISGGGTQVPHVYRGVGGSPLTSIASTAVQPPDVNGTFLQFIKPVINDAGQLAFRAQLSGTHGGTDDDVGVFRGSGGTITQMAREYADVSSQLTIQGTPAMSAGSEVAFNAIYDFKYSPPREMLYVGSGGSITPLVRQGMAPPDQIGIYSQFSWSPALNDSGQLAFWAHIDQTTRNSGIFVTPTAPGGEVTKIARKQDPAAKDDGFLDTLSSPALNELGQVAFLATLSDTLNDRGVFLGSGGPLTQIARRGDPVPDGGALFTMSSHALNDVGQVAFISSLTGTSNDKAIFLANGIDLIQVVRKGQLIAGQAVTNAYLTSSSGIRSNQASGINDHGQVAYLAELANGDKAIIRFTIPEVHWTHPTSGLWTTNTNWTQSIQPNSFHDTFINPTFGGTITGNNHDSYVKSLSVGDGLEEVSLLLNSGGDLEALQSITIHPQSRIEVATGHRLTAATLSNEGVLTCDNGHLRFEGGATNSGTIAIPNGFAELHGPITNTGVLAVSGGATANIHDDLTNAGAIEVGTASTALFSGMLSGNGASGPGTVFLQGGLRPGTSLGVMAFGGDVRLLGTNVLEIELGGTSQSQWDTVAVQGSTTLAGTVEVTLVDPMGGSNVFAPSAGDTFEFLAAAGGLDGTFDNKQFPDLGTTMKLDIFYAVDRATLAVVPKLAGDYNFDGAVDVADYTVWRDTRGQIGPGLAADGNRSGAVGSLDYDLWKTNFGMTTNAVPTSHPAVPEPSWPWMVPCVLYGLWSRRVYR